MILTGIFENFKNQQIINYLLLEFLNLKIQFFTAYEEIFFDFKIFSNISLNQILILSDKKFKDRKE